MTFCFILLLTFKYIHKSYRILLIELWVYKIFKNNIKYLAISVIERPEFSFKIEFELVNNITV